MPIASSALALLPLAFRKQKQIESTALSRGKLNLVQLQKPTSCSFSFAVVLRSAFSYSYIVLNVALDYILKPLRKVHKSRFRVYIDATPSMHGTTGTRWMYLLRPGGYNTTLWLRWRQSGSSTLRGWCQSRHRYSGWLRGCWRRQRLWRNLTPSRRTRSRRERTATHPRPARGLATEMST